MTATQQDQEPRSHRMKSSGQGRAGGGGVFRRNNGPG